MLNLYILNELLDAAISLKYNLICEPSREIFSTDEFRVSGLFENGFFTSINNWTMIFFMS